MKVNELDYLYVGYNEDEDFRILICATDTEEAYEIADEYRCESHMDGKFEISEFTDVNTHFDCDYVVQAGY